MPTNPTDLDDFYKLKEEEEENLKTFKTLWQKLSDQGKYLIFNKLSEFKTPEEVPFIVKGAYHDEIFRTMCESPALIEHWHKTINQLLPYYNQNNGKDIMPYEGISTFESLELAALVRLFYLNTRAKKGIQHKHTQALLDKIFSCKRFHLIQMLIRIERYLLQKNKATVDKSDINYYLALANRTASLYGTHGCFDAAMLLAEVGAFLISNFQDEAGKKLYAEALKYLYLGSYLDSTYFLSQWTEKLIASGQALNDYELNDIKELELEISEYLGSDVTDQIQKEAANKAKSLWHAEASLRIAAASSPSQVVQATPSREIRVSVS